MCDKASSQGSRVVKESLLLALLKDSCSSHLVDLTPSGSEVRVKTV